MGYTTEFQGKFTFNKEPTVKVLKLIGEIHDPDECKTTYSHPFPGSYCQWQVTKEMDGIEWDGGEKFYKYTEWLQWIIDNILKPAKLSIRGRVTFQGEESDDAGVLVVQDDQHVRIEKMNFVPETLEDLVAFRDFVFKSSREVIGDWKRSRAAALNPKQESE